MVVGFDTGTEPPGEQGVQAIEERYVEALVGELRKRFARPDIGPEVEAQLGTPEEAAARVFGGIPQKSPWDNVVGPMYTTPQPQQLLGCSRQAIRVRTRRHTLLALPTRDRHVVYPAFQFDGTKVHTGLAQVLQITAGAVDDWTRPGRRSSTGPIDPGREPSGAARGTADGVSRMQPLRSALEGGQGKPVVVLQLRQLPIRSRCVPRNLLPRDRRAGRRPRDDRSRDCRWRCGVRIPRRPPTASVEAVASAQGCRSDGPSGRG